MQCDQASQMMSERLDGRLNRAQMVLLQDHLAACSGCQTEWERWQQMDCLFREAPMLQAPVRLRVQVMDRVSPITPRQQVLVGGVILSLGSAFLLVLLLLPVAFGLLNVTQGAPLLFDRGSETVAHLLSWANTMGRLSWVMLQDLLLPLAVLGLCSFAMAVVLNGLFWGLLRRAGSAR